MSDPFSPDGPRQLLSELCRLVAERAPAEEEIVAGFHDRNQTAETEYHETQAQIVTRYHRERAAAEAEYTRLRSELIETSDAEQTVAQKEYDAAKQEILARFESEKAGAEQELQEAQWESTAIAEAAKSGSGVQLKEAQGQLEVRWKELLGIHQQAVARMERWGQWREFPDPQPSGSLLERHPMRRFLHALELARSQGQALAALLTPRFAQGLRPMWMLFALWGITVYPAGTWLGWDDWRWAAVSCGGSVLAFLPFWTWLHSQAKRRATDAYLALRRTLVEAGLDRPATLEAAKADCHRLYAAIDNRQRADLKRAGDKFAAATAELLARKQQALGRIEATYPPRLAEIAAHRQRGMQEIEGKYPRLLGELDERYQADSARVRDEHARTVKESRDRYEREWAEMTVRWVSGVERFRAAVEQLGRTCDERFPDWTTDDWSRWTQAADIPPAACFGYGTVELGRLKGGIPRDERLRPAQTEFRLPALLPLPLHSLLMFQAEGEGRARAIDGIQAAMLRLLTALPPGKVRFTIIDPVGLGQNFSAFMHLADYDEQLVASRIWTDADHIEQRLADLTQHMENVIQVYLRNEFQSIQEYNAFAGEMAEPYRVLVVANFPANFSDVAAQRLKSIVASGARCGVFVLLSVDAKLPVPHHFQLADLEAGSLALHWNKGQFFWHHPEYGPLALALQKPPPAERFTEIVRAIGHAVKDAGRVEVPFHCIVPPEDRWWTADSRGGIDVPLGRAGAMKLQHLDLGKGTSQHVLISGKTGSGKSTLLHVLITNLAARYSPDEIELYLVDFKKGVEFKAYARYGLPHARVIAIESEREFGLSVLQRLDAELRSRGDLFRRLGVQDLKGYRNSCGAGLSPHEGTARAAGKTAGATPATQRAPDLPILPRILLIIDEFQELFVEDDRIAQEGALLLDRLVRQGRAFGIHVLLGSQTLGGAYSLARSTIGQMAVRIALQCSESDAHLILSEDNTAARLLTRPGEAIYNDANGLYEGNHPFQIVWLPDDERDDYLQRLGKLALARRSRPADTIVFEGNVLADLSENPGLRGLLAAATWPESCPTPHAWLGSAVAIKEPTAAALVRQAGSNLLLVGHREEASIGVMASCLLSLALQHPPGGPGNGDPGTRFYVLDGARPEAPEAGFWRRIAPTVPHAVRVGEIRETPQVMAELSEELARRQQAGQEHGGPAVYLFVYNLGRFRDLRKEEDYGFGGMDDGKPPSPAKQFGVLLREGPALGIHTIAWCDSYSTLTRLLDRQSLRDFELRVLFQMSATDSSSLMDSPEAGKLGVHRAIYYDEGQGAVEKFRPYGPPPIEWLARVQTQLRARCGIGGVPTAGK
jgi:DNA segregation ATPase FtsK/SpoIIIE, S-DNA-T family